MPELSPREALGLELAAEGNPLGPAKFLDWTERELLAMLISGLPSPVAGRLKQVHKEVGSAAEFVRGFLAATNNLKSETE